MDKTNAKIKQQLMGLAKISKDNKADNEKYSQEVVTKQKVSSKQRQARISKAEKREERHRAMRQGVNDMFHEQMKLVDQITINIKQIGQENEKIKFEHVLAKKVGNVECLGKILI